MREQRKTDLEQQLEHITNLYNLNPSKQNRINLDKIKTELNLCLTDEAENNLDGLTNVFMPKVICPPLCLQNVFALYKINLTLFLFLILKITSL